MRTLKTCLAATIALALSPALAVAQTTVEQTIQIGPGGGAGGSDSAAGHDGRTAHVQDRHGPHPRACARERRRWTDSPRAGPHLRPRRGAEGGAHRCRRPLRVPRAAGRPLHAAGDQVRVRERSVRTDAAVRVRQAHRARRQAERRQRRHQHAARQRHRRTHRRRVRRRDSRRLGDGDASELAERPAPARALARARRANERPGTVPDLWPAAGRVLRERVASQWRPRDPGHGVDGLRRVDERRSDGFGTEIRLRPDVLPGHAERRRGAAHYARRRSGIPKRGLCAGRRPSGEGLGDCHRLGRQAARRVPGVGRAGQPRFRRPARTELRANRQGRQLHAQQRPARRLHAAGPVGPGHHEHAGRQRDGLPRDVRRWVAGTRNPDRHRSRSRRRRVGHPADHEQGRQRDRHRRVRRARGPRLWARSASRRWPSTAMGHRSAAAP